jgi:excisionase family DNA binding protein
MATPRKEPNQLPMMNRLLLSTVDVASLPDLSYFTTSKMIREGQLPSIKIGTNIRVPLKALEEWIEKNTEGGEKK